MPDTPKEIRIYISRQGHYPYDVWYDSVDRSIKPRIRARILRLSLGNPGDVKPVGEGVHELRLDIGLGYRVYFGNDGSKTIILLGGGDKSTQERDIARAKEYWRDYRRRGISEKYPN